MDTLDAFKSEIFRPLTTLVVPGSVAAAPYVIIAVDANASFATFWSEHPNYFIAILGVVILAAGFVLDDLGARLESAWDKLLEAKTRRQNTDWAAYLCKEFDKDREPIGQHYIRTIVIRFKFELSFGIALIFNWLGLLWIELLFKPKPWAPCSFALFSFFLLLPITYLLWESYASARLLADTRHILLTGKTLEDDPLTIPSGGQPTTNHGGGDRG